MARYLIAIFAAAWLAPLHGQAIYKCVGADGKTSYSNSPCPGAKQIRGSPRPSGGTGNQGAADVSMLPQLQLGKWMWTGVEGDTCGDPLDNFRAAVSLAYTNAASLGCTARLWTPAPNNTLFVMDCPADRSENGVNARKGKLEISVYAPSPQNVRVSTKAPGGPTEIFEAKRLGDC